MTIHPTHNLLSQSIRAQSIEILNRHLAASIDLHGQVKQAHWNVRGPGFIAVHELFDKVSEEVESFSDMLAERTGSLGGTAQGTVQIAADTSYLVPYLIGIADEKKHIFAVAAVLASFAQAIHEAIKQTEALEDPATVDLFTQILSGVEHQLWFVESHMAPQ